MKWGWALITFIQSSKEQNMPEDRKRLPPWNTPQQTTPQPPHKAQAQDYWYNTTPHHMHWRQHRVPLLVWDDSLDHHLRVSCNNRLEYKPFRRRNRQHTGMHLGYFLPYSLTKQMRINKSSWILSLQWRKIMFRAFASSLLQAEASHDDDEEHGVALGWFSSTTNF